MEKELPLDHADLMRADVNELKQMRAGFINDADAIRVEAARTRSDLGNDAKRQHAEILGEVQWLNGRIRALEARNAAAGFTPAETEPEIIAPARRWL